MHTIDVDFRAQKFIEWINEALATGARRRLACDEVGISLRTLQHWTNGDKINADARTNCTPPEPSNKLSEQERQCVLSVCDSAEYAGSPPSQIVPR